MPKTLLLADDSVTIQKVVGISFASEDIAITTVDNGRDAVAKAREMRPDIILADVVMPGMSGYEVCQAVKADANLRHIPVLLLTGTFEAFDESRAASVGAAGHVAKPFEAQTLVDRVKQLLAATSAAPVKPVAAPVKPAAAPPPIPSRPAAAPPRAGDDAFEFFSEDREPIAATARPQRDALDLDGPDAAFAFGDDDLGAPVQEPRPAPPLAPASRRSDATVAMFPDPPPRAPAQDDPLEFSFARDGGEPLEEPVDPAQLAHTTLLDPAAASNFDVSSSDLSGRFAFAPPPAPRAPTADLGSDLTETDPLEGVVAAARSARDPIRERGPRAPAPAIDEEPLEIGEPIEAGDDLDDDARPFGAAHDSEDTLPRGGEPAAPLWSEVGADPLEDAFETPRFDPDDLAEPLDAPGAEPIRPASIAGGADSAPTLSPVLRSELHDTIEKIAWDAFGQVTEKVVREAIERIEQVAWEVVPKLAETLILEEIRRLKARDGE